MLKVFKKEYQNKYYEVKIINIETGEFTSYHQALSGFPFGKPYNTNVFKIGYSSVKECIKELKSRGNLGQEISHEDQKQSEKIGYINLGVERIKRAKRVNTNDFEDVINKLVEYGLSYCDAQNKIIAAYENM